MTNAAFEALCALRSSPNDDRTLDRFLIEVHLVLRRFARRVRDPDDVASVALIRVREHWATCRAENPGRFGSWLRMLVRRCAADLPRDVPHETPAFDDVPDPGPDPHEHAVHRGRGRAVERAIEAALNITPAALPPRDRAWARLHHVAATPEGIRRDLEILLARLRGESLGELAVRHAMSVGSTKKAGSRGVAALVLGGRVLAATEPDLLVREGFHELQHRLDPDQDTDP